VTTFTGTTPGYTEGGPALAQFQNPTNMAPAPGGGFYVADFQNQVIRLVDTSGTTQLYAGTPMGVMAPQRLDGTRLGGGQFLGPFGIAKAANGDLYISEFMSHCIRKVDNTQITTVAGTPLPAPAPMGMCMPGNADGAALTVAQFQGPMGIAVDVAGNIYVADAPAHTIRKIAGGMVTTIGTSGMMGNTDSPPLFNFPRGLAMDGSGNILIADSQNGAIRRMTPSGNVTTVATGLNNVMGVAYHPNGDIYASETGMTRIWRIRGQQVDLLAGTGMPGMSNGDGCSATFGMPGGLLYASSLSGLLVADMANSLIRLIK
jgi:DNA-binding beta-propeller fold protein YncE